MRGAWRPKMLKEFQVTANRDSGCVISVDINEGETINIHYAEGFDAVTRQILNILAKIKSVKVIEISCGREERYWLKRGQER